MKDFFPMLFPFFPVLFFGGFIVLLIFGIWYNSPKQKGKRGEKSVNETLDLLPNEYFSLNNIMLATKSGTTQIDHVVVSKYGLFTIETKNYRGKIYGDDARDKWTQVIVTNVTYAKKMYKTYTYVTKNELYNPVKQSQGHAYVLKKLLNNYSHLLVVPIVVFLDNADISGVYSKEHVIHKEQLLNVIRQYKAVYLTDDEVQDVKKIIEKHNLINIVGNRTHVANIKHKQQQRQNKISAGICPQCGGRLVFKRGKYGDFYGCINYPQCSFTAKV